MQKEEIIRNEIIEAASLLFQQYGFQKTTMEDIAKTTGKGKSTLYYYFANKEEVFDAVVTKEINEVFLAVNSKVTEVLTAKEKIAVFASNYLKEVKERTNLYKIVCGEFMGNGSKLMFTLRGRNDIKETEILKKILETGICSGEFGSIQIEDIDILSHTIVSALRGIEVDLFIDNKLPGLENRIDLIIGIIVRGLH
jgi:AcrR family transcriptional regulator